MRICIAVTENTLRRLEVSKDLKNFDLRCYFYCSKSKNVKGCRCFKPDAGLDGLKLLVVSAYSSSWNVLYLTHGGGWEGSM